MKNLKRSGRNSILNKPCEQAESKQTLSVRVCLSCKIWIHEFAYNEIGSTRWQLSTNINASSFHNDPPTINNREKKGVYVVAPEISMSRSVDFRLRFRASKQRHPATAPLPIQPNITTFLHWSSRAAILSFIPSAAHREGGTQATAVGVHRVLQSQSDPGLSAVRVATPAPHASATGGDGAARCPLLPSHFIRIWRYLGSSLPTR